MRKLVLILALAGAAPALAEPTTPGSTRAAQGPNARICRTTQVLGSRVGRVRRCATRQEWVEYDLEQRRQTQETLRQGTQPQCMTSRQATPGGPPVTSCQ